MYTMPQQSFPTIYPAREVTPLRAEVIGLIRQLEPGQAVNIPSYRRATTARAIARLNKTGRKYRIRAISPEEFAVIRDL